MFKLAAEAVLGALRAEPKNPRAAAVAARDRLKSAGDQALRRWPPAARFRFAADFAEPGGGWESVDAKMSVRTESATADYSFTPASRATPASPAGGWELNWVSRAVGGEPLERFSVMLQKLFENPPDDCTRAVDPKATDAALQNEDELFSLLGDSVLEALNKSPKDAQWAVAAGLTPFEDVGDRIAAAWPVDHRLRYKLALIQPLAVLTLSVWNQSSLFAYAPDRPGPGARTRWIVAGDGRLDPSGHAPSERLQVFPLWRGPSGDPRFLAVKHFAECMAGLSRDSMTVGYEWIPSESSMTKIIERDSQISEHDPPGKLQTSGKVVSVPYCWSGGLQISIWAPICSVDSYDLSGDAVRYTGTKNSPEDLAVVAKVLEYAESHDFTALRGYCVSGDLARRIVEAMPPGPLFEDFQRKNTGAGGEVLELQSLYSRMKFTLKRAPAGWLVTGFELTN